jgi:hypothetical protein
VISIALRSEQHGLAVPFWTCTQAGYFDRGGCVFIVCQREFWDSTFKESQYRRILNPVTIMILSDSMSLDCRSNLCSWKCWYGFQESVCACVLCSAETMAHNESVDLCAKLVVARFNFSVFSLLNQWHAKPAGEIQNTCVYDISKTLNLESSVN